MINIIKFPVNYCEAKYRGLIYSGQPFKPTVNRWWTAAAAIFVNFQCQFWADSTFWSQLKFGMLLVREKVGTFLKELRP